MLDISRTTIGVVAGVAGTLFIGYCVYFDQQRRKDPDFKKKLRERRRAVRANAGVGAGADNTPDLKDHEAVQRYFLQQVQAGEELLAYGNLESGVEHLCRAVVVCAQPQQLLMVLQQTLPTQVFELLLKRLPEVSLRIKEGAGNSPGGPIRVGSAAASASATVSVSPPSTRRLQDEDVE